jgi:hypothetical protein
MPRASVALLFILVAVACTDGNAPPQLIAGDFGVDEGVSADLSGTCSTACDCMPGESCLSGKCEVVTTTPILCCSSSMCSGDDVCQFSDGTISQCDHRDASPVTPIIDGGIATSQCEATSCTKGTGADQFCQLACGGAATCVGSGGNQHCMP